MRKRRIERTALSLAACMVLFGALATAGQAQAQGKAAGGHGTGAIRGLSGPSPTLEGAPSTPGPTFNPSIPYTVPQSPETPVSPGSPGSVFGPR
jgi:hypothetical protein